MPVPPDLRALIAARGSIAAVARALGMPKGTLDNWLQGRFAPPAYRLAAVRAAIEALPERRHASSS